MNRTLWTLQIIWGFFFSVNGFGKIVWVNNALWEQAQKQVPWFSAVGQDLLIFIVVCEFLGGIGLILPAMTGVKPKLTAFAGVGLTTVMVLAAAFHVVRGEYGFVIVNVGLGSVPAFIAYGRLVVRPIESAAINASRVMKAAAVFTVFLALDLAPVLYRYRLTRSH